jgi:hypothetical protein
MVSNSYEVIFQGLDTLHLVYRGSFNFDWWKSANLKEKKFLSQKKREKAFVNMGKDIWEVSERGTREYAYCLMRNGWRIYLFNNRGMNSKLNQMKIEVPSTCLRMGDLGYIEECRILCCEILSGFTENIQRVDIAVDVEGFCMTDFQGLVFYGYPKKMRMINSDLTNTQFIAPGNPGHVETLMIGKNPLIRIYDKKKKAIKDDQDWFHTWYEQSYDTAVKTLGGDESKIPPITRFEFQLRSETLKEFNFESFDDFWERRQGVWNYLTQKWLDCKIDDPNKKSKRRLPSAAIWEFLRAIEFYKFAEVKRERPISYESEINIKQILGHLSSYCAKENIFYDPVKYPDFDKWLDNIFQSKILRSPVCKPKAFEYKLTEKINRIQDFKPPENLSGLGG